MYGTIFNFFIYKSIFTVKKCYDRRFKKHIKTSFTWFIPASREGLPVDVQAKCDLSPNFNKQL